MCVNLLDFGKTRCIAFINSTRVCNAVNGEVAECVWFILQSSGKNSL